MKGRVTHSLSLAIPHTSLGSYCRRLLYPPCLHCLVPPPPLPSQLSFSLPSSRRTPFRRAFRKRGGHSAVPGGRFCIGGGIHSFVRGNPAKHNATTTYLRFYIPLPRCPACLSQSHHLSISLVGGHGRHALGGRVTCAPTDRRHGGCRRYTTFVPVCGCLSYSGEGAAASEIFNIRRQKKKKGEGRIAMKMDISVRRKAGEEEDSTMQQYIWTVYRSFTTTACVITTT